MRTTNNVIDLCPRLIARGVHIPLGKQLAEQQRLAAVKASHWTGAKHVRGRDITLIAKDVRKDIASAIKAGTLPAIKTTVRSKTFSGGQSLYVTITQVPAGMPIANPERARYDALPSRQQTGRIPPLLAPERGP